MKTTCKIQTPGSFPGAFQENFDSGDVDRVVAAYHPEAVLNLEDGNIFPVHSEIRAAMGQFMVAISPIIATLQTLTVSPDNAVAVLACSLEGKAPDGKHIAMTVPAIDVFFKDGGNGWKQLIDLLFGSVTQGG